MQINFTPNEGFYFVSTSGSTIEIEYRYPLPDVLVADKENLIYLLWAEKHQESDVIPVSIDEKSCGWIFTIGAIDSSFPQCKDNKYFRIAAWSIFRNLVIRSVEKIERLHALHGRTTFILAEFIDTELSILALHKPMLPKKILSYPQILIPQMLQKGLYQFIDERTKSLTHPSFCKEDRFRFISTVPIESFYDFHIDLLVHHIPYTSNPVFKFYLYYQIIESMMESILAKVGRSLLKQLSSSKENITIYDEIEKYKKNTNEKSRIAKVFDAIDQNEDCIIRLRSASISFLQIIEPTIDVAGLQNKPAANSLYRVRNQLMHNYRRTIPAMGRLDEINAELDLAIPTLLCKFSNAAFESDDVDEYWFSPS